MADDGIEVVIRDDGGVVVIVQGELDMVTSPGFGTTLGELGAESCVVVNMAGVDFMDSTGLHALVTHYVRMSEAGGSLRVRDPSVPVQQLLVLTDLERLLESSDA